MLLQIFLELVVCKLCKHDTLTGVRFLLHFLETFLRLVNLVQLYRHFLLSRQLLILLLQLPNLPPHFLQQLWFLFFSLNLLCQLNYFILHVLNYWIFKSVADFEVTDLLKVVFLLYLYNVHWHCFFHLALTFRRWKSQLWSRNWGLNWKSHLVPLKLFFEAANFLSEFKIVLQVVMGLLLPVNTVICVLVFRTFVTGFPRSKGFQWFQILLLRVKFLPRQRISLIDHYVMLLGRRKVKNGFGFFSPGGLAWRG